MMTFLTVLIVLLLVVIVGQFGELLTLLRKGPRS